MPSVTLALGKYVTVRPRKDGTYRVLFEVPARLRPSGWSEATVPLPLTDRRGNLDDAAEVARIRADAARLLAELEQARGGGPAGPPRRTVETLIADWQATEEYRFGTKPRTKAGYEHVLVHLRAWSGSLGHPDPTHMTEARVRQFLATFDDRPWAKWHMRKVLRLVMARAIALGWRTDNPVEKIRMGMPASRVTVWEAADVELYAWAAIACGQPGLAAIILTEWEIGQRLTDVVLFRHGDPRKGAHFQPAEGVFSFAQSKTGGKVTIPVSGRLRAILALSMREGSPYLFHDGATGRPFRDVNRLTHVFEEVRRRLFAWQGRGEPVRGEDDGDGRYRVLRALRHSCVVQLARAGCELPEIAAITGHALSSVQSIIETYLPRDSTVARNAQRKRGLIGPVLHETVSGITRDGIM